MRKTPTLCCALLFVFGLFAPLAPAQATTVLEQTFPDLVHNAEVIVVGTVTGVQERWDATRQAPFTDVTLANVTVVKGTLEDTTLTLEFLGGHAPDGTVFSIAGVPQFTVGEKTVVFSAGNHRNFCPLVGLWQGRLRVSFDPQRGVETVSDNFHTPIVGVQSGIFLKAAPEISRSNALPLSTLIDLIQQEMGNSYGR